jgi:AcrR family transcriptional regulator
MTSLRHTDGRSSGSGRDPKLDAYLDAARECILDVGWRRTTLTEVARRSGVSRMTIYRTWSDMASLLGDLMTREWVGIGDAIRQAAADTATPDGIATAALATVGALRDNDLFVRIVELDPELLLPYLLHRRGRSQTALAALLAEEVREGQAAGVVRDGSPEVLARSVLLAGHGFVYSVLTMVDDDVTIEELDAEFHLMVAAMLAKDRG